MVFSSRSIKRRKFDDELVESSLGAAFGSPMPKAQRTRTQSLNMLSTGPGLYFIIYTKLNNKKSALIMLNELVSYWIGWDIEGTLFYDK